MINDEIKFKIDQLRKDKIIYGVEAVAFSSAALLMMFVSSFLIEDFSKLKIVILITGFLGIGYTLYMGIGNLLRLLKIKKLERKIKI